MSAIGGPNIVEDGLVLALDAANDKSFRGEPTVNLLSIHVDPTFENGTKTSDGWAFDAKINGTYDYYSLDTYSGTYSVRLQNSTNSNIAFWRVNIPVVSGQKYTMSTYAKNINCPTIPYFSGVNISLDAGQNASFTSINNKWQRFTATYTATTTGNAQFYIRTSPNTDQGFFLIDNFQIEEKPYATPFVNGTRGTTVATGGGWADRSGNNNHGELVNGPTFDSGNLGSIEFDGVDDSIVLPNPGVSSSDGFSIELILKPSNTASSPMVIVPLSGGIDHFIRFSSNGTLYLRMIPAADSSTQNFSTTTPLSPTKYHHVVFTFKQSDGGQAFYNGNLESSAPSNFTALNWTGTWRVGQRGNNTFFYQGNISILKVYNRALTAQEVLQNYTATKSRYGL